MPLWVVSDTPSTAELGESDPTSALGPGTPLLLEAPDRRYWVWRPSFLNCSSDKSFRPYHVRHSVCGMLPTQSGSSAGGRVTTVSGPAGWQSYNSTCIPRLNLSKPRLAVYQITVSPSPRLRACRKTMTKWYPDILCQSYWGYRREPDWPVSVRPCHGVSQCHCPTGGAEDVCEQCKLSSSTG